MRRTALALSTDRQRIQHLLRRAGFGYSAAELARYTALGLEGTVDVLLHPEAVDDSHVDQIVSTTVEKNPNEDRQALFATWNLRLIYSNRPLLEKLTYFWHDHFATGIRKVDKPSLMLLQNETLRANALGSYQDMLLSVTRDPAMLIWLDNRVNTKGSPNENYAREVMELYTLGRGNGYTETDIHEAARAFTGWRIVENKDDGTFQTLFQPNRHDAGTKTVLGATGKFKDVDVIGILAEHPGTPRYVGAKLWNFFAVPDPTPEMLERTSRAYFENNGSIREMVRTILLSDEMYSPQAYRWRIKSPVELLFGAERALEASTLGTGEIGLSRDMGQLLFDPPDPAGWAGGTKWVNSSTMLYRANFANLMSQLGKNRGITVDIASLLRRSGATSSAATLVDYVLDLLVGGDVDFETRDLLIQHVGGVHYNFEQAVKNGALNGMVYLALGMPLYQLA